MINDLRLAIRLLRKAPGYTAAAVATLALAIGANAAVFSAVYVVLLKPLPIQEPDRLVVGWGNDAPHNLPVVELSYRVIENLSREVHGFSRVAAMGSTTWPAWLKGRGAIQRVSYAGVTGTFFDTLGARPALGRTFRPEDDAPNAPPVAILSHGLWVERFGADPSIVGSRININDQMQTVVGVMPRGFDVPRGAALWMPVGPGLAAAPGNALENIGVLFFLGRLAPGVTRASVNQQLNAFADATAAVRGGAPSAGQRFVTTPFVQYPLGPVRQALWALLATVGILLLIGCANVSGLMLTRVSRRRREHGIRLALGATPAAIGGLWIIETLVLSAAGGLLGFIASYWIVKALVALAPPDVPRLAEVGINLPVAVFSFIVVSGTALLCGVGPIRQASASNLIHDLIDESRATSSLHTRRLRSGLVVVQIALSIVLLVAAALVLRSFVNLRRIDLGFDPAGVLTMNLSPSRPKPSPSLWMDELITRIGRLPHVDAAGAVYLRPLALGAIGQETPVLLEGQPDTPAASDQNPGLNYEIATSGYFTTMRIALKRGRVFDARDDARSPPVVILSESAARRLWPGQDPIGKRLLIPDMRTGGRDGRWRTVVGVVADVRYRGLDDVRLDIYEAALQAPIDALTLVVRTSQNPAVVASAVQAEARRLNPDVFIDGVTTMEAVVGQVTAPWRFSAWTFALFAAFAFGLAIVGLFSLVMLDVTHRHRELAIRLALGARRADVLRSVLVPAGVRALAGTALGVIAALAASRTLRSLMFGISTGDRVTYAMVIVVVFAVVAVASYVPARRAACVDPAMLFTDQ